MAVNCEINQTEQMSFSANYLKRHGFIIHGGGKVINYLGMSQNWN